MGDYWVGVEHEGIQRDHDNDQAVLFLYQDRNCWIPKSQLKDYDEEMMIIPRWLADEREMEPDYEL